MISIERKAKSEIDRFAFGLYKKFLYILYVHIYKFNFCYCHSKFPDDFSFHLQTSAAECCVFCVCFPCLQLCLLCVNCKQHQQRFSSCSFIIFIIIFIMIFAPKKQTTENYATFLRQCDLRAFARHLISMSRHLPFPPLSFPSLSFALSVFSPFLFWHFLSPC